MARSSGRRSHRRNLRRARRSTGGGSLISRAKRTVFSPFFWGMFAVIGVGFAAFYPKALDLLSEGGQKIKSIISKG